MKPIGRGTGELSGAVLDDRYELHAVIGEGAFGRVYRGVDRRLARAVAVKVIKSPWGDDPEWVESFEREAQMLARVSDPGIVQIFDVGHAPEGLYYVAELVDGESLASRLRRGPLPYREASDIAEQLCRALAHAHEQRVVHRDIKPANVLLSKQGRVKIGDFGVARLAESTTEVPSASVVGTPKYMAPEQARGLRTTPSVDIYSTGVLLYEMIAGRPPFSGSSSVELAMRHAIDRPDPLAPETPRDLAQIVVRAMAKEPDERYPDARSMAHALALTRTRQSGADETLALFDLHEDMRTVSIPPAAASAAGAAAAAAPRAPAAALPAPAPPPPTAPASAAAPAAAGRDRTWIAPAPPPPPRRVDPVARRRDLLVLTIGSVIVLALIAGAILLPGQSPAPVQAPRLLGLSRAAAARVARHTGLRAAFSQTYSFAPPGTTIGQQPQAGALATPGSLVRVVLSAGPRPVKVPGLVGLTTSSARSILGSLGLAADVRTVPAPGTAPGTVTDQAPGSGSYLPAHRSVALSVAETPTWRPLTTVSGTGAGHTVPFRTIGTRFRIVYRMHFDGMCTFIIFCSGPSAQVTNLSSGATASQFGMQDGSTQIHVVPAPAGLYQVRITPGSDTASWSLAVDDYY